MRAKPRSPIPASQLPIAACCSGSLFDIPVSILLRNRFGCIRRQPLGNDVNLPAQVLTHDLRPVRWCSTSDQSELIADLPAGMLERFDDQLTVYGKTEVSLYVKNNRLLHRINPGEALGYRLALSPRRHVTGGRPRRSRFVGRT